jgi:hypothetical protein
MQLTLSVPITPVVVRVPRISWCATELLVRRSRADLRRHRHGAVRLVMRPFGTLLPLWVDTVEKVPGVPAKRNNRIIGADFLQAAALNG